MIGENTTLCKLNSKTHDAIYANDFDKIALYLKDLTFHFEDLGT